MERAKEKCWEKKKRANWRESDWKDKWTEIGGTDVQNYAAVEVNVNVRARKIYVIY